MLWASGSMGGSGDSQSANRASRIARRESRIAPTAVAAWGAVAIRKARIANRESRGANRESPPQQALPLGFRSPLPPYQVCLSPPWRAARAVQQVVREVVRGPVHGVEMVGAGGSAVGGERRRSKGHGRHAKRAKLIGVRPAGRMNACWHPPEYLGV